MSTPASAFVEYRNQYLQQAGISKSAALGDIDWAGLANSAGKFMSDHPMAMGALGGAGIGALSGLFSSRPGSVLRNALIGGGLGAGAGLGYDWLKKSPQRYWDTSQATEGPPKDPQGEKNLGEALSLLENNQNNPMLGYLSGDNTSDPGRLVNEALVGASRGGYEIEGVP